MTRSATRLSEIVELNLRQPAPRPRHLGAHNCSKKKEWNSTKTEDILQMTRHLGHRNSKNTPGYIQPIHIRDDARMYRAAGKLDRVSSVGGPEGI